ncbi:hypothetical protein AWENTII_006562 [Aspergillus wentii]|nr:hypothetical protein MW887_006338 [Aspergillus wentii]
MGLVKVLLKAILIPIVFVIVVAAVAFFLFKRHRDRKKEDRDIENRGFQPPPIQQWGTGHHPSTMSPVQKPEAVVYPMQYQYQYPVEAPKVQQAVPAQ